MEKIVQLSEYDYNKLYEKANLNSDEILRKAEELYAEKGIPGIKLSIDTKEDYEGKISFKVDSYIEYQEPNFELNMLDKRRIVNYVNDKIRQMMIRDYGKQITDLNHYNLMIKKTNKFFWQFVGVTISGWVVASILLLNILLK